MKMSAPFSRTLLAIAVSGVSFTALADAEFERKVEERLAKLEQQKSAGSGSLLGDKVVFAGLVEVAGSLGKDFNDDSYSDLVVKTVELGISAAINDKVEADIILLYEEDETELDVDVATLSFDKLVGPVDLLLGKQYLPFGRFETALVNDTLILELTETNKTAALFGLEQDGFYVGAYLFDGSVDRERNVENYGVTASFGQDNFNVGFDYISALTESDNISDVVPGAAALESDEGAFSLSASLSAEALTFIAEYMTAIDDIEWVGGFEAQPSAFQLEVDFAAKVSEQDYTFAFAIQETDDAGGWLPEQRLSLGASTEVYENVGLGVEYWRDTDYSEAKGGTDEKSNNIVVQLAVEF